VAGGHHCDRHAPGRFPVGHGPRHHRGEDHPTGRCRRSRTRCHRRAWRSATGRPATGIVKAGTVAGPVVGAVVFVAANEFFVSRFGASELNIAATGVAPDPRPGVLPRRHRRPAQGQGQAARGARLGLSERAGGSPYTVLQLRSSKLRRKLFRQAVTSLRRSTSIMARHRSLRSSNGICIAICKASATASGS